MISIQFDPETTSDVVHRVEVSRLDCVLACLRNGGKVQDSSAKRERQSFRLKALYEPNRTGCFSIVLILKQLVM